MTGVRVHPKGLCESEDVGDGTRVWAFAHVLPGARIGRDCNICDGAFVESRAVLGNNVTVKNGTLVFDGVTCEDDVFLGPNVLFTNDLRPRAHVKKTGDALETTLVRRGATLGSRRDRGVRHGDRRARVRRGRCGHHEVGARARVRGGQPGGREGLGLRVRRSALR